MKLPSTPTPRAFRSKSEAKGEDEHVKKGGKTRRRESRAPARLASAVRAGRAAREKDQVGRNWQEVINRQREGGERKHPPKGQPAKSCTPQQFSFASASARRCNSLTWLPPPRRRRRRAPDRPAKESRFPPYLPCSAPNGVRVGSGSLFALQKYLRARLQFSAEEGWQRIAPGGGGGRVRPASLPGLPPLSASSPYPTPPVRFHFPKWRRLSRA